MPSTPRWEEIEALFDEALRHPRGQRQAWLAQACPDDDDLRRQVQLMVAAHERTKGILEAPIEVPAPSGRLSEERPTERIPTELAAVIRRRTVGPYRLLRQAGQGGMGVVYQAHDPRLDRFVALKFLPRRRAGSEATARFVAEAKAASGLDHPNICTIHDVGETEGGQLYIVMAYYEGETLAEKIARGPVEVEEAVDLALQAATGLARAHGAGIIHRDVKPANLMVTERPGPDRLKILDFGIAKLEGSRATRPGSTPGTLAYMSPEQLEGGAVDLRTDLWSLGVVLYEMLTAELPFRGSSGAVVRAILAEEPRSLRSLRPGVPRSLERVVEKALSKLPARRQSSAAELIGGLEAVKREVGAARAGSDESALRVFITSTSEELDAHRAAAVEIARGLGMEPVLRDPAGVGGLQGVSGCVRQVASADLVLALVGHRRGRAPAPELGGDGFHPWAWWEIRAAFDHDVPVKVLMASEAWRPELREDDSKARSVMHDFRGELGRLAVVFDDGSDEEFRELVHGELTAAFQAIAQWATAQWEETPASAGVRLRRWRPPEYPQTPYPVLLPYTHPDLMAGRDRELAELRRLLARPVPILGLHAASGTGKSSLLAGVLVPVLRGEGRPVAFEGHPTEPGIARRLLGDLLEDGAVEVDDDDPQAFAERLCEVLRLSGGTGAVLVLDQFEDLLRQGDGSRGRVRVGALMAATVQRQPGVAVPPCRWLLAYRQEFHGQLFQWLRDVLRDFDGASGTFIGALPHDLSGPERFHAWALPPLGTPPPGTSGRAGEAARIFQAAIEKPLELRSEEGGKLYRWRFAGDGAARLGRAFGEARRGRRGAPLVPELQVVLAHLMARAARPADPAEDAVIEVPQQAGEMIDRALEDHLRRSLDAAFLSRRDDARSSRTRAFLALRELADAGGRRGAGLPATALARAIGRDGADVLEKLATPETRLVLCERRGDEQVYVLSHDRMAAALVRLTDDEGALAGLGVDAELLGLRRFVTLQRELFETGEVDQATEVPKRYLAGIARHSDALIWDDKGRRWWTACRERRRRRQRHKWIRRSAAAAAVVLLTVVVWARARRTFERRALVDMIAAGDPEASFAALARLTEDSEVDSEELLTQVRKREAPYDVLERGLGGVGEEDRGVALLRVVALLLPFVAEPPAGAGPNPAGPNPEYPVWIASAVWALDFFAVPEPTLRPQAVALRDEVLGPLRKSRPPPPLAGDPQWADIPAGTFMMGSGPGEGRDEKSMTVERPKHPVRVSAFRLLGHEVTNAELGCLFPAWSEREEDLPAGSMSWHEAYTYAAWLGGRLPTEAEWEYAARAGCAYAYCRHDGSEATLDEVAWWRGNSADPETGEPAEKRVMQREPNPWGLYDMYGNLCELTANWFYHYPEGGETDPAGPTRFVDDFRMARGGSAWHSAKQAVSSARRFIPVKSRFKICGFRVALPEPGGS